MKSSQKKSPIKIAISMAEHAAIRKEGQKQRNIDRKNSAAARKKLREEGRAHEYKTKRIPLKKMK